MCFVNSVVLCVCIYMLNSVVGSLPVGWPTSFCSLCCVCMSYVSLVCGVMFYSCVFVIDLVAYQRGSLPGGWPTRGVVPQFTFPPF